MENKQKTTISVIGGHSCNSEVEQLAQKVGKIIAEMDCILVCGGLSGVMEAACKGAKNAGGTTIGLLPGKSKADANPYVDIALPTTIGFARNAMVAASADVVVALPGSYGTSCEISYAFVYKRPVIDLGGWNMPGMLKADDLNNLPRVIKEGLRQAKSSRSSF